MEGEEKGSILYSDAITKERLADNSPTILLKWIVPQRLTIHAGTVKYALAVIDENYVWQTKTSTFTVLPNLGIRNNAFEPETYVTFETLVK
jgi:hypothetical protein